MEFTGHDINIYKLYIVSLREIHLGILVINHYSGPTLLAETED